MTSMPIFLVRARWDFGAGVVILNIYMAPIYTNDLDFHWWLLLYSQSPIEITYTVKSPVLANIPGVVFMGVRHDFTAHRIVMLLT